MDIPSPRQPGLPNIPSPIAPSVATPPPTEKRSGELSENEASFILDAELSKKRRNDPITLAFIESFVRCKNLAQASHEAGIHKSEGYKLRHYVDVSNAITKLIDRSAIKYGFDASEIMERVKETVDFDPIAVYNPDGTFKSNMFDIPPEARRNIKKLKVKNIWSTEKDLNGMDKKMIIGEIIEYEFYDKQKAIDQAGKEKDLFKNTTVVKHDVTDNMAEILLQGARRGQDTAIEFSKSRVVETSGTVIAPGEYAEE